MTRLVEIFIPEKAIMVTCTNGQIRILYSDILYIECIQRKICFFLKSGEKIFTKQMRSSFFTQLEPLFQDARFICPHQSFFVNLEFVQKFFKSELVMDNGQVIPISKKRCKYLAEQYQEFLAKRSAFKISFPDDLAFEVLKNFELCIVIFSYDAESGLVSLWYANHETAHLYGLSLTQIYQQYGTDISASIHPSDVAAFHSFLSKPRHGAENSFSYRLLCGENGYRQVNLLVKTVDKHKSHKIYGIYFPVQSQEKAVLSSACR